VITYSDFDKVDIRVGRVVQVDDFPEARKPAYRLLIDFGGDVGLKKSTFLRSKSGR
jgi:tRNA-binding protein